MRYRARAGVILAFFYSDFKKLFTWSRLKGSRNKTQKPYLWLAKTSLQIKNFQVKDKRKFTHDLF